jgi:hypothetical protein
LALKTLASRAVEAAFNLSVGGLAMRASLHSKRYNIVMADLDSPSTQGLTKSKRIVV